jgi:hypothetical protein
MVSVPLQSPPVDRNLSRGGDHRLTGQEPAGFQPCGGVQASQSWCDRLTGPAQSLCYAAEYGISV